jgi:eukaryotic-like serine/threonine-protein kinase
MPHARVVHIIRQMCHSLSEAHARGLVPRDVKPANVFLCRYGEEFDFVKLLDFGLVKALDSTDDSDPALTLANAVHGTPSFIAPEQALGRSDLDGRVDIYSTGCVAYRLLTGQFVFNADTPMGLVVHHAHAIPSAPSTRTDRPIPKALDQLILSCLAKDRRNGLNLRETCHNVWRS